MKNREKVAHNILPLELLFYDWDELAVATGFSRQHQLSRAHPNKHKRSEPG
jgi:hypothetical protein